MTYKISGKSDISALKISGKSDILHLSLSFSDIFVKSSDDKTHASLDNFCEKYSKVIAQRYLVYKKDLQKDGNTLLIPFYMIPFI